MNHKILLTFKGPKELGSLTKVLNDEGTIYYILNDELKQNLNNKTIKLDKPKKDNPIPKSIREGNYQIIVGSFISGVVFETKDGLSIVIRDKMKVVDNFYPYINNTLNNKMPSYPLIEHKKIKLINEERLKSILNVGYQDLIRIHQNNYIIMYEEMKSKIIIVTRYLNNLKNNIPIVYTKLIKNKGNHNDNVYRTTFQLDSLVNVDVIIGNLINETEHLNRKLIYAYKTLNKD